MCKLTIFTATYNRGHLIERMYRALQRQSCFDFEWLVIDDGSQDNTPALFSKWVNEGNPFPIRYYRQKNQGLIRTLNRGIELANGEFFSKVDSDDYVVDSYMENIIQWISSIKHKNDVYAVSGIRVDPNGVPLKGCRPTIPNDPGYVDATDLDRKLYNLDADMSEAWKTEVLRKHPFPIWPGEKFAPEQLALYQIAMEGLKIRWYPEPMCICEYQEGGLTRGASSLEKHNPMGYAMMYNQNLILYPEVKSRLRNAMQMTALCSYAHHLHYLKESNCKWATILSFPLGVTLGIRRKLQYAKLN